MKNNQGNTEVTRTNVISESLSDSDGFVHKGVRYVPHNNLKSHETALEQFTASQKLLFCAIMITVVAGFIINWHASVVLILAALTLFYFFDALFNLFLITRSITKNPEISITNEELEQLPESALPTYTILCPLYHEANVLPQFVQSISKLDYDTKKLQVLLLLEENDDETINAAKSINLPEHFTIVIVPHSRPKTKPKACNFGLKYSTGECVVIYDAEDAPDPLQLKKSVIAFRKSPENVVCLQSKLNFYNPHHNTLTRAFTAEYSTWFDLVLPGLQSIAAPIPLGGTSNHFKTSVLRQLGGWDAFNVTEDADLGMRIVRHGYQTAMINSVTLEEANSNIANWYWQRSRWIKGYIQTYLVHSRRRKHDDKNNLWNLKQHLMFRMTIASKIFMLFLNPIMWALTLTYFLFRPIVGPTIESFYSRPILYMGAACLIFGNFMYMYYYMIGCATHRHYSLIKYAFLVPLYWLGMSVAAWRALYEIFVNPHHWRKTKHGLHLGKESVLKEINLSLKNTAVSNSIPIASVEGGKAHE